MILGIARFHPGYRPVCFRGSPGLVMWTPVGTPRAGPHFDVQLGTNVDLAGSPAAMSRCLGINYLILLEQARRVDPALWPYVGSCGTHVDSCGLMWTHVGLMWTHLGLMWTHVGLMWIRGGAATSSPTDWLAGPCPRCLQSWTPAKLSQIWLNLAVPQNALNFIKKPTGAIFSQIWLNLAPPQTALNFIKKLAGVTFSQNWLNMTPPQNALSFIKNPATVIISQS